MGLAEAYHYVITEVADERTNDWPLVGSPVPLLLLTFAYLYFVLGCGQRYMRDKQPYTLETYIKCYDLFQVLANFIIVQQIINAGFFTDVGLSCAPLNFTYEPGPYKVRKENNDKWQSVEWYVKLRFPQMAQIAWWIMCVKILDFSETVVYVFRKKNRQISGLHLYHHVSTAWLAWILVKYYATGVGLVCMLVNCSVHVIMYTYYFLSSFGPAMRRYTDPFKRYVTIIQMVQFVLLFLHSLQIFLPGCPTIGRIVILYVANLFINFMLFFNFYRKTYVLKKKE